MRSVIVRSTVQLSSPPAEIWPLITDTDRINRLLVGSAPAYAPIESGAESSARYRAVTRALGLTMSYEEAPFEWTLNKSFSVYRRMLTGPLRGYTFRVELAPGSDDGTALTIVLELEPRHWALAPLARLEGKRIVTSISKIAEGLDAHVRRGEPSPFEAVASSPSEGRLDDAQRELEQRGIDTKIVLAIIELLRTGADADLTHIRPLEFAHARALDGHGTLRAFLHAVLLGVVELRWALVCPSCRTASDEVASLASIGDESHCHFCDLSFGIELDRAVEATFVPHPSVRAVRNAVFCIGGPARTPHVVAQAILEPGRARAIEAPPSVGRYRLFARGGAVASVEVSDDAPSEGEATMSHDAATPAELRVSPGGTLTLTNGTGEPRHVKLEHLEYASRAATAHLVTTMSEFRRFFSKDLLKPSTPLKVASCAILFSDLTGSTALYTAAGDAAAFRLVADHFDVLQRAIDAHGGSIVKTMGDAVMASFIEPGACVRAAIGCLEAFERFRSTVENGELTGIKLGLFAGPCYVVTANEALDYFGQTVNTASRVQHCAESGELVFEEEIWARLPKADTDRLRLVEILDTRVKGLDRPLRLVRTRLASEALHPEPASRLRSCMV